MTSQFQGRDLVHIGDLSLEEIHRILDVATDLGPAARGETTLRTGEGTVLGSLFFEPSTRTRLSFETAMARLGGASVGFADPDMTSVTKGETLADTVRVASTYADALVIRHPHEGAGRLASQFATVPVINGGDGAGQHPTQTLVDLYTIRAEKGRLDGNRVGILGDLRYGRTVHSLAHALARVGAEMVFVAPETLQMPDDILQRLTDLGADYETTSDLTEVVGDLDVLYTTRIQRERFPDPEEYRRVQGSYRIDEELLADARKGLTLLHPLPRVDEIDPSVDDTDHARYFQQAANGVPVRMALLSLLLGLDEGGGA